jgi:uncharacterized cysteine cluster protein YcgN (CxxCxxCC family)
MSPTDQELPFWKAKAMADFTQEEWESLCDGCAKCCLHKLQDEESDDIVFTNVACHLLDMHGCACTKYKERTRYVPDCVQLTPNNVDALEWMPVTCAYWLIARGEDLPAWHPLVSGDPESVHKAGMSARGRAIGEFDIVDLEDHVVEWPDL